MLPHPRTRLSHSTHSESHPHPTLCQTAPIRNARPAVHLQALATTTTVRSVTARAHQARARACNRLIRHIHMRHRALKPFLARVTQPKASSPLSSRRRPPNARAQSIILKRRLSQRRSLLPSRRRTHRRRVAHGKVRMPVQQQQQAKVARNRHQRARNLQRRQRQSHGIARTR